MKIGMILDKPFPPDPRVENEALFLISQGHEVHLYCLDYEHQQAKHEQIKGIHVYRQHLPKHVYRFSALAYTVPYYSFFLQKSLKAFAITTKIEAFHIHDIQVAQAVFMANKNLNLPIVLDLHENRPEIMKYYAHVQSFLGKLLIFPNRWKKFEYRYIKEANNVIVITEAAKQYYLDEIAKLDATKFCVVPNTVRKAFYTNYDLDNDIIAEYKPYFTILYLGDTGLRRGMITIIRALEYIIPIIPNIKLVIVGSSKTDNILKKLVADLGYEQYVDLKGWQNFKLFQSFLTACHISVCPIHKNIHHETTFANKIFQSLSFGKPIVVSDCKAQADIVYDYECGLVFEDRNIKDFADKILTLHKDKDLYNRLSNNATKAVQKHLNWNITAQTLKNLYEKI
ncbi:MAG: glycosyltransferase family 4 protein [Chitinophagales bacterium]